MIMLKLKLILEASTAEWVTKSLMKILLALTLF